MHNQNLVAVDLLSINGLQLVNRYVMQLNTVLEMWANAQRDGRPAKYRWRPLFNAAKFG